MDERRWHCAMAATAVFVAIGSSASAQPTPEQQDTIRHSCRSDYIAHCMSVPPGGADALHCLQHNLAQLSQPCQSAVSVTMPKPATPGAPAPKATQ